MIYNNDPTTPYLVLSFFSQMIFSDLFQSEAQRLHPHHYVHSYFIILFISLVYNIQTLKLRKASFDFY